MGFFSELLLTLLVMGLTYGVLYGGCRALKVVTGRRQDKKLGNIEAIVLIVLAVVIGNMIISLAVKG
ncbi:hypothetical protein NJC38_07675 [Pseudomonas sp. 21LCFQ010]|uniref:hypothetical protein n=1 Tax=Pseudomonas sp. 21LCFQ010 TaxID=2957506 RepID=UPI0020981AE0|nr:hypothetical protein [Pseudomonas sp. 21LCFQ010]MCO8162035.1 hypothetical protein [Pseudomonas sp. 21LCFQ010]